MRGQDAFGSVKMLPLSLTIIQRHPLAATLKGKLNGAGRAIAGNGDLSPELVAAGEPREVCVLRNKKYERRGEDESVIGPGTPPHDIHVGVTRGFMREQPAILHGEFNVLATVGGSGRHVNWRA